MHPSDFERMRLSNGFDEFRTDPLRLYMICRRQRISYDASSFKTAGDNIHGFFRVQLGEDQIRVPFTLENQFPQSEPTIECPYPHRFATFRWPHLQGRGVSVDVTQFARQSEGMQEHFALEVLYIGKAYGREGSRTAPDRLEKHSTLQRIQAELNANSPDTDVWLILWSLNSRLVGIIDGQATECDVSESENDEHVANLLSQNISGQFETDLAEAALIHYFQPSFNKQFKETFPQPGHQSYSKSYEWDLKGVVVELNTEELGVMLKTSVAPPAFHHMAQYSLRAEDERNELFEA
jgi:hypothetical protein